MNADEQAIRSLIGHWLQATRDGDVDAVLALMEPDAIFLVAGQSPMQGRGAFEQRLRSVLASHTIDSHSTIDEVVVSGALAYCRTTLSVTITSRHGQLPVQRAGSTLSILRKGADGQWRMARDANLLGPPA